MFKLETARNTVETSFFITRYLHLKQKLWGKKKTSPLFVPYNFDGNMLSSFMIKSFHHLSKGAFPQNLENFVSISKMIVQSFKIATILIIITC